MQSDAPQAERFFGNRLVQGAGKAFDVERFAAIAVTSTRTVPRGPLITLGFDGSKRWDHASLIGTEVETGYEWPLGIWRPEDFGGEIPASVVTGTVDWAFDTFDVWRLYGDPPYWEDTMAGWAGKHGKDRVVEWWTNRPKIMAGALRSWREGQRTGAVTHCAKTDEYCALFTEHVGNAIRFDTGYKDDDGQALWVAVKDRKGSPNKIDSVPAATLSWEARNDAIADGALNVKPFVSVYEKRGIEVFSI